nr:hypothetical protein [Tanacetum cinerariifolium]
MIESPIVNLGLAVPVFSLGDDPISCLKKAMAFLTVDKAMLAEAQKARHILDEEKLTFLADLGIPDGQETEDLNIYDYDCDDMSNVKAVLMANISNYSYVVISG